MKDEELSGEAAGRTDDEAGMLALFAPVYAVVRSIPVGKVMTYGQVADAALGISVTARQVGAALRWVPADVPWQRVVGAGGHLPIAKRSPDAQQRQRQLLENEGVIFLARDPNRVDMPRSQWFPDIDLEASAIPEDQTGSLFSNDSAVPPAS